MFKSFNKKYTEEEIKFLEERFTEMCNNANLFFEVSKGNVNPVVMNQVFEVTSTSVHSLFDYLTDLRESLVKDMKRTIIDILQPLTINDLNEDNCVSYYTKAFESSFLLEHGNPGASEVLKMYRKEKRNLAPLQELSRFAYLMQVEIKTISDEINEIILKGLNQ